jgi:dCTP deaminase
MTELEAGGILSGLTIKKMVESGDIEIDPWDPTHVNFGDRLNPASYDLTLGPHVAVYSDVVVGEFGSLLPGSQLRPIGYYNDLPSKNGYIDVRKKNPVKRYEMDDKGLLLMPGIGYLMHTAERIKTDRFNPILDGKSSIGRLFLAVHVTAGYGDAGFDGQYTLEVIVTHPTIVVPGMRFCQMRFHTIVGEVETYGKKGNYQGELAKGPVESRSWKMFPQEKG